MPLNIRQVDNVDRLPPPSTVREIPPWQPDAGFAFDWRVVGVLCLFFLLACPLAWLIVGRDIREWISYGWGGTAIGALFVLGFIYTVLRAVRSLLLVEQPGGFRVAIWNANAPKAIEELIAVQSAFASTPYRGVAAQTIQYPTKIEAPPALPAPPTVETLPPTPEAIGADTWLPWLDAMPHLLVAGRTGDGKTTLGNALLGRCINAGDEIAVIDPKWQPGKWRGCAPLAGSLDYDDLYNALEIVGAELDARYQEFNQGRPGETFPRLRVVIDEVPTIILGAIVGGKIINKRRFQQWLTFATKLGSIAREVNVHVWLFSQSPLIKDLYFSSSMRDNFNRIALASQVRDLLGEESNKATKEALLNLTRGKAHTAAMEYRSTFYVLDMSAVPSIAQERVSAPQVWLPPQPVKIATAAYQQPLRATASIAVPQVPQTAPTLRSATPVADLNEQQRDALVQTLRRRKWTQDAIRDELRKAGLTIAQDRLVALCQQVDRASI